MGNGEPYSGINITGTGEFERDGIHVISTVEVRVGTIHSVAFAAGDERVPPGSDEVVAQLVGQPVSTALAVNAGPDYFPKEGLGLETREVLLEAFHRAVESCLDQQ